VQFVAGELSLLEHPSLSFVFPSSHCSVPANIPSPQVVTQVEVIPPEIVVLVHFHPGLTF